MAVVASLAGYVAEAPGGATAAGWGLELATLLPRVRGLVSARGGREGSRRGDDQLHLLDQARRSIPADERDPLPPFERMVEAIETNRLLPVSALDGSVSERSRL